MNSRRLPESLEGTRRAASGAEQEMGWAKPGPQAALSFPTPTPSSGAGKGSSSSHCSASSVLQWSGALHSSSSSRDSAPGR